ncbi:nucleotidyltransferase [Clostridia bacterium]|nr:nucleotidyltransferase [Clostridia bacterium]
MVYSIQDIKNKVTPIAVRYNIPLIYLFGSYAWGNATESSDIDILIDKTDSKIKNLFDMGLMYNDFSEVFAKTVDIITTDGLQQNEIERRAPRFLDNLQKERVLLYEKQ